MPLLRCRHHSLCFYCCRHHCRRAIALPLPDAATMLSLPPYCCAARRCRPTATLTAATAPPPQRHRHCRAAAEVANRHRCRDTATIVMLPPPPPHCRHLCHCAANIATAATLTMLPLPRFYCRSAAAKQPPPPPPPLLPPLPLPLPLFFCCCRLHHQQCYPAAVLLPTPPHCCQRGCNSKLRALPLSSFLPPAALSLSSSATAAALLVLAFLMPRRCGHQQWGCGHAWGGGGGSSPFFGMVRLPKIGRMMVWQFGGCGEMGQVDGY